jgi:hypothetical protein
VGVEVGYPTTRGRGQSFEFEAGAPTSPAHHFRLLSDSKKGKFPENILEKPSAARKSLENNWRLPR